VRPQTVVVSSEILPVSAHIGQQLGLTVHLKDSSDVLVFSRSITVLFPGSVTIIWPTVPHPIPVSETNLTALPAPLAVKHKSCTASANYPPESMSCPRINRSRRWLRVPELGEQDEPAGIIEAACVFHHGRILTTQRHVCWT
jgi:hypothetical protein